MSERDNSTTAPSSHVVGIELNGVAEQLDDGAGAWRSCSGCHNLNEGHPTGPWSDVLKCHLGVGCFECGGIGAIWDNVDYSDFGKEEAAPADKMVATDVQREAWMDGDTTGAYVGTEASKRLPLKVAPAEQLAALMESGQAFANQVRAVTYKLNGQAYSITVSALNQFDSDLRRTRAVLADGSPPPSSQMVVTSAPEILSRIAEVAAAVGFQAGEPAMELAGQIVSVLAGHPEHIDRFMDQGTELFLDGTFGIENGTLTYRAINGQILSPSVIREKKGTQQ